jgi:hypothetical protein
MLNNFTITNSFGGIPLADAEKGFTVILAKD